jgi:hypothetical protein
MTKEVIEVKKKKVAIVGFAGTKDKAPYNNPEFEIWTVNNLYQFVPRQDRIFELHSRACILGTQGMADAAHGAPGEQYEKDLQAMKTPIYMQEKFDDIPASIRYPIEEIINEFGVERLDNSNIKDAYFTNSISFMLALAIREGFEEIHVYGVDMAVGGEYNEQRPSCEYYLGIARGRGIKIYIPPESDLLKARHMYGYEDEAKAAWELKLRKTVEMMNNQKRQSDTVIRNQQSVSDKYEGAITALIEMERTWGQ